LGASYQACLGLPADRAGNAVPGPLLAQSIVGCGLPMAGVAGSVGAIVLRQHNSGNGMLQPRLTYGITKS
jgi:hypothetical protein